MNPFKKIKELRDLQVLVFWITIPLFLTVLICII
ncbi:MAG: hypothetical protein K0S32_3387 [Bacteroidetes bacterium]|jgi:hypothetical protein|nr:hypothetical protein [Bacteroidota bacterium]